MYDLIAQIINHIYSTNYSGDQQYIYYICGALILLFCVTLVDMVYRIFHGFCRMR